MFEIKGINADGSRNVKTVGSEIMQPVDIQGRLQQTIQTHNAVSVSANPWKGVRSVGI